jgi:hypothetical protein
MASMRKHSGGRGSGSGSGSPQSYFDFFKTGMYTYITLTSTLYSLLLQF